MTNNYSIGVFAGLDHPDIPQLKQEGWKIEEFNK